MAEFKRCSKGDACVHPDGPELPATAEYFYTQLGKLRASCKACRSDYARRYREANPEKAKERDCRYHKANPEKAKERLRRYREANADKVKEHQRRYLAANADKVRERERRYRAANADKVKERRRRWREANPEKANKGHRRWRTLKRELPFDFTAADELRAIDYFNGCCAVCERPLSGFWHTAAMDHWIALSDPRDDNPGTVAENMVPLCHGVNGCNNRKHNADPVEWLEREFGTRKARAIVARIEAYFEWIRVGVPARSGTGETSNGTGQSTT